MGAGGGGLGLEPRNTRKTRKVGAEGAGACRPEAAMK